MGWFWKLCSFFLRQCGQWKGNAALDCRRAGLGEQGWGRRNRGGRWLVGRAHEGRGQAMVVRNLGTTRIGAAHANSCQPTARIALRDAARDACLAHAALPLSVVPREGVGKHWGTICKSAGDQAYLTRGFLTDVRTGRGRRRPLARLVLRIPLVRKGCSNR
jgi:hypothetical protein